MPLFIPAMDHRDSFGQARHVNTDDVLDNVVWGALDGPQSRFATVKGKAARFDPDVSLFAGLADHTDPDAWRDLADLAGPGADVLLAGPPMTPPPGWETTLVLPGVQLIGAGLVGEPDPESLVLGPADLPEILDLVERTKPGPFRERTMELGSYLGIRREGRLIALAGERLRVPGWTEISAVCTDPAFRGQGLAARLIKAVTAGLRDRGDRPFLHAAADNTGAIRLYQHLGFAVRTPVTFAVHRTPGRI
jgi:ribosomal protein S18 acetylase RimI-like enzyme